MLVRASRQSDDVTAAQRRFNRREATPNNNDVIAERDKEREGPAEEDRTGGSVDVVKVFADVKVSVEDRDAVNNDHRHLIKYTPDWLELHRLSMCNEKWR